MQVLAKLLLGVTAFAAVGCAPGSYLLKPPTPSGMKYEGAAKQTPSQLSFVDERRGEDRTFSTGVLPAALKTESGPIDAMTFLSTHTLAELASRGIPVTGSAGGLPQIHVRNFRILNYRSSGFAPFVTLTFISADVETASGKKRIGAFMRRGKVPVWSFDEVIDPIFNQPLSIGVKEFASKVANTLYSYRASDAVTKELIAKLSGTRNADSFLDVYALGFTNNPLAISTLVELTHDGEEYIRMAAIASLGNVGAKEQFELLKSIYQKPETPWQDRAMAIKSIGDLGTAESIAFATSEISRLSADTTKKESLWLTQILALYL